MNDACTHRAFAPMLVPTVPHPVLPRIPTQERGNEEPVESGHRERSVAISLQAQALLLWPDG
jgi:hypothetical protein